MRKSVRLWAVAAATAAITGLAAPAQAASTVVALWNMDAVPKMADSAGGDNNGKTTNVRLSGGAYDFGGRGAYATVPDKANLDPGTAPITLSARVKFDRVPRVGQTFDIVRKGVTNTSGGYYKMEITRSSSGRAVVACRFRDREGRTGDVYGSADLAGRGFQEVSCRKTAKGVTVSAAGKSTSVSLALGSIKNSSPVYIGSKGDGTDWYPGLLDFVRVDIG
ncbi:LamG domain-containing protein [Geodermatophilus sp. YIM 151500]|uniref:LamG domain-containing protein n=1 Tax=Geodermatophilus sp. YIM 151500 TaxID=2984531 RepID=UPI0021E46E14|nr:LamG domain-containing protein [Geodermatophilus sp. YIM 151500]MCV2489354.1 LamG domain-containing protein [Geodermatophilus sp. YIM 151500]